MFSSLIFRERYRKADIPVVKIRLRDPLIDLIENPAHIDPEIIKEISLEALEEDLWGR